MTEPQRERLEFDLANLPAEARFRTWQAAMAFWDLETADPFAFDGRGRSWRVPPLLISDIHLGPLTFMRTPELILADQKDDITLQFLLTGQAVGDADGVALTLRAGDIALQDMSRPLKIAAGSVHMITIAIPRAFLDDALPGAEVHGVVLRGGMGALFAGFLRDLPAALEDCAPGDLPDMARLLRDLLAGALRQAGRREAAETPTEATLRSRARRYISRNLTGDLEVGSLCRELGASRSSLYRAFEREGGIASYVQRRRLARIYRLLCDPAERRSVSELAGLHGFHDNSHFSRLFRRTFGFGPRTVRERAAAQPPIETPLDDKPHEKFARWRELEG
ncbi:helix-turn-helix domain-containing protein [Sphingosinicella terrae]|uniref:AraC-like ligand-binding domain-containing protein n=1 Tax=Sphingosinicella terrae TaxID=2172047 RepID=UPI000E0DFD2D|nr:helix-turn-helix domain-containing protein [Sphingosinicella terrae]